MNRFSGLVLVMTGMYLAFDCGSLIAQARATRTIPNFSPPISGTDFSKPVTTPSPWQDTTLPRELYTKPSGALGHWGVGNGGDWLRIGFARARDHAATVVSRLKPDSLRHVQDATLKQWLIDNQQALAADILASEHVWGDYENEQVSCALTWSPVGYEIDDLPVNRPIRFAYTLCRESKDIVNFNQATQLLIHEAVHHFDKDCDFADKVAIAIVDAWRSGSIDWMPVSLDESAPEAREHHSAVWNGEVMIVFGGKNQYEVLASAAAYQPSTDSWRELSEFAQGNNPRFMHQAHWAEDRMIVWGGYQMIGSQTKQWQYSGFVWHDGEIQEIQAPAVWGSNENQLSRSFYPRQQSVWTGTELLVWGGMGKDGRPLGGAYNPTTKQWTSDLGRDEIFAPQRIEGHSLVWTGSKLIVWGGSLPSSVNTNRGAIYDPQARPGERWSPLVVTNPLQSVNERSNLDELQAPSARLGHTAIWTGQHMVIFSGGGSQSRPEITGSGGIYDPVKKKWELLYSEMVVERLGHTAVWNGHEMLIFGGRTNRLRTYLGQVFGFEPESHRWQGVHSQFGPSSRENHSAVWTGSSLIIWGGSDAKGVKLDDGGIFYP
ncbi:MAG: Kelch repeat-containing protein [Oligoflexus sp.]